MKQIIAVTLSFVVLTGIALADVIQQDSKPITVVYKNGVVEHYLVRWIGSRTIEHHEDGGPSKPFEGHPFDDRRCHWAIDTIVLRNVYLLNQNGQAFLQPELVTPVVEHFANQGNAFVVTSLASENCGQAEGRYQSDIADSTKHMSAAFPATVAADLPKIIATMRSWPNVKEVQPK